jgi:hypothetical protein
VSQCKQILAVLSDGREHEMRDIHTHVGFCRLNSRVAELRSRGHVITCRRSNGNYFYRLEAASPSSADSIETPAPNPSRSSLGASASIHSGRDGAGVLTLFGDAA